MFDINIMLAAFGGGLFGAAVGGLPAFIMCGIMVLIGQVDLAFGPYFGPHIAFAGGVAAAAYASKKELVAGTDILTPLVKFNDAGILIVGGVFGVGGYLIQTLLAQVGTPTDTVAATVALSGIAARLIFGKSNLFSKPTAPSNTLFQLALGLGVGLISAYATLATNNVVLGFGVAAVTLIVLQFMGAGPVTHHLALPAAVAAAATGNILVGALFGILGVLVGDFVGKLFGGDTHIDPPAVTITILTTVVVLFLQ